MTLKKGDFIQVEYTGTIKDGNIVFDTTDEKVAKEHKFQSESTKFGPVVVVLGEHHLLKGLDSKIEGKPLGTYEFDLTPEEAFGKKAADLIKLVPLRAFKKDDVHPQVGMEVGIDDQRGIVRSVSGGRILVDFNHPLSGKELHYKIKLNAIVTDAKEKVQAIVDLNRLPVKSLAVKDNNAVLVYQQPLPEELVKHINDEIKRLTGVTVEPLKTSTSKPTPKEETVQSIESTPKDTVQKVVPKESVPEAETIKSQDIPPNTE